jgi:peptidoglycan L-alanyl-D-glutamate endopeptidase CwlK
MSPLARLLAFLGLRPEAAPAAASTAAAPAPALIPVSTVGEALAPPPPAGGVLTARDRERLRGVRPELVRVVERARAYAPFLVSEGLRTPERQRQLLAEGKTRTLASRHITGHAVDLYPISAAPIPAMTLADYADVVAAMRRAAAELGIRMEHGFDWGWDAPHHELHRLAYPPPPA